MVDINEFKRITHKFIYYFQLNISTHKSSSGWTQE